MVFFCSGISLGLIRTLGFSGCYSTFLSSPRLWLIVGHIHSLFVPCVGSLVGWEAFMRIKGFESLRRFRAGV